jgi:DNA-binding MarR family transcriptional regulator
VITSIVITVNSDLQEKLKQTRPFTSAEEAVYLRIQIASEEMRAGFNELFKTSDLTLAQYNVLRILRGAADEGLSCREISERMINRDSDITRMLDRLEARGLIKRERQTDDRRVVLTYITKAGVELLAGLDRPVTDLHKRQLRSLTKKELETLASLLTKLAAATK